MVLFELEMDMPLETRMRRMRFWAERGLCLWESRMRMEMHIRIHWTAVRRG